MAVPLPEAMNEAGTLRPYAQAATYFLLFFLLSLVGGSIARFFTSDPVLLLILAYLVTGAGAALFLSRLGWWEQGGFTSPGRLQDLPLYLLPCAVALLSLTEGIAVTGWEEVACFALFSLVVAWTEEAFFRGLVLRTLLPAGIRTAVVVSALLFGLPHLLNALGGIWNPWFALADTFAAFGIGITLAAIVIRTGTIWPPVVIHALVNFTALLSLGTLFVPEQTPLQLGLTVGAGVVMVVYGLWLIREIPQAGEAGGLCRDADYPG
jgi:hypothetical protein